MTDAEFDTMLELREQLDRDAARCELAFKHEEALRLRLQARAVDAALAMLRSQAGELHVAKIFADECRALIDTTVKLVQGTQRQMKQLEDQLRKVVIR